MALEKLTRNLEEMSQRASDVRPMSDEVHGELLAWQRTVDAGEGDADDRLGPSLENAGHPEHIWDARPSEFTFGTMVPYSAFYQDYRIRNGQKSHMALPREALRRLANKIGNYITTGNTL